MSQGVILQTMKEGAEKVQAVVNTMPGLAEAISHAVDLTVKEGGKTLAAPGMDVTATAALKAACEEAGVTFLEPPLREDMGRIHTAFTWADHGIADTGTLVLNSNSEELRIATMLSETHVAVLPSEKVVPSMEDLTEYMTRHFEEGPGYVAFITGASRTADIERILTIGVHGPERLHILLLEGGAS